MGSHRVVVIAVGRCNGLFPGSETGGETAAILISLLGSCWANQVSAWAYLKDVLDGPPTHPADQLEEVLPHKWIEAHPEARLPRPTSWHDKSATPVAEAAPVCS